MNTELADKVEKSLCELARIECYGKMVNGNQLGRIISELVNNAPAIIAALRKP